MRTLLWRLIEWHLGRHLTAEQRVCTIGDLAEDVEREDRVRGRLAGSMWLAREALSVSTAYRAGLRQDRRLSRRCILGASWLDDARFAVRRLMKQPAASVASMATLGCAIAAAAVTWSLLSALLLDPLPGGTADRLFVIRSHEPGTGGSPDRVSEFQVYAVHRAVRDSSAFAETAATGSLTLLVHDPGDSPPRERRIAFVSHQFFHILGVHPAAGRGFDPQDDRRGAPLTAIISDRYWRTVLGRDPDVIGRTMKIAGQPDRNGDRLEHPATIIGIAPRPFRGVDLVRPPDIYLPLLTVASFDDLTISNPLTEPGRSLPTSWIKTIGRLPPAATTAQVEQRLNALPREDLWADRVELVPLREAVLPPAAREPMRHFGGLLAATVGLLLLIGCVTAGVLLLVRTEARRDELTVCLALGGTRWALTRGIVIEGALVAAAGVALAVPLAWWLFQFVRAFRLPGAMDLELLELTLDRTAWLGMAVCGAAAVLLIGTVAASFGPALRERGVLQSRASATPRVTRRRMRAALVVVQVAVAVVLVAGATQLVRSLQAALSLNTHVDVSRVATGEVSLRPYGYTPERAGVFFDALRERLSNNPAIESVSLLHSSGSGGFIRTDGARQWLPTNVRFFAADDRYFSTLGLPIVAGRNFLPGDTSTAPRVAVVSESFARLVYGHENPLGRTFRDEYAGSEVQIVGVVPDVLVNVGELEPLTVYYPMGQQAFLMPSRTLVVRATRDPAIAIREATTAMTALDSHVTPAPLLTIRDRLALQMGAQHLGGAVLGAFGAIAVLLTLVGAYVLGHATSTARRREFGIRAALGASGRNLGGIVLVEMLKFVGGGVLLGLGLAWLGAGLIRSFMFQVEARELQSLLATSMGILMLALVASLRPAFDAMRVDLARTLRDE